MTDRGGIVVEQDLMVPARDGVVLATDVYRPAGPGPFPVLLEQSFPAFRRQPEFRRA